MDMEDCIYLLTKGAKDTAIEFWGCLLHINGWMIQVIKSVYIVQFNFHVYIK